jgi:hypothetical protein
MVTFELKWPQRQGGAIHYRITALLDCKRA